MRLDLAIHIAAGTIGIVVGFVALFSRKGARTHRKSGMAFVYAMLVMTALGAVMAAVYSKAPATNIPVAILTAYLVVTGLTTVRPIGESSRVVDGMMLGVVSAIAVTLGVLGVGAMTSPSRTLYGMPFYPFIIFSIIGCIAAIGDVRVIRAGGTRHARGTRRLRRHLWRMSTALLIAAFSFFLGQAKVIPKPIRILPLLSVPPLVVLITMLYWLWRRPLQRVRTSIDGAPAVTEADDAGSSRGYRRGVSHA